MILQSRLNRSTLHNMLLSIIPEVLIALTVAVVLTNKHDSTPEYFVIFVATLAGLYFLYFIIWIKNSIWGWLVFYFVTRKRMSTFITDMLDEGDYPKPLPLACSEFENYFIHVIDSDEYDLELRIKAAGEYGAVNMLRNSGYAQHFLKVVMSIDDGLNAYQRVCRGREKQ